MKLTTFIAGELIFVLHCCIYNITDFVLLFERLEEGAGSWILHLIYINIWIP